MLIMMFEFLFLILSLSDGFKFLADNRSSIEDDNHC